MTQKTGIVEASHPEVNVARVRPDDGSHEITLRLENGRGVIIGDKGDVCFTQSGAPRSLPEKGGMVIFNPSSPDRCTNDASDWAILPNKTPTDRCGKKCKDKEGGKTDRHCRIAAALRA